MKLPLQSLKLRRKKVEKTIAELQRDAVFIRGRQQLKQLFDMGLDLPLVIK